VSGRRPTYDGPERRASLRVPTGKPLKGELAIDLESEVLRLSTGGMLVRLPFPLVLGTPHVFTLIFEQAVMEVSGLVRSCQPLEEAGPAYGIGVEFEGLDDGKKRTLESFVARKLKP